jgi:hypothetical protein
VRKVVGKLPNSAAVQSVHRLSQRLSATSYRYVCEGRILASYLGYHRFPVSVTHKASFFQVMVSPRTTESSLEHVRGAVSGRQTSLLLSRLLGITHIGTASVKATFGSHLTRTGATSSLRFKCDLIRFPNGMRLSPFQSK